MAIYIGYQKVTGSGGASGGDSSILMSQAEYDAAYAAGALSANVTYMTPDGGGIATKTSAGIVRAGFNGGSGPDANHNFPVMMSGQDAYVGLQAVYNRIQQLETLIYGGNDMDLENLLFDVKDAIALSCWNKYYESSSPLVPVPCGDYLCYIGYQKMTTHNYDNRVTHETISLGDFIDNSSYYRLSHSDCVAFKPQIFVTDLSCMSGSSSYRTMQYANSVSLLKYYGYAMISSDSVSCCCASRIEPVRRIIKSTNGYLTTIKDVDVLGKIVNNCNLDVFAVPLSACHWPVIGS